MNMTHSKFGRYVNNTQEAGQQRRRTSLEKKLGLDSYDYQTDMFPDMVNHPPHYNASGIECIDAIAAATDDGYEYYLQGNIMKYVWRYRYKNGLEDLHKAQWYLSKLVEAKESNGK
jgi:hypothetical protein